MIEASILSIGGTRPEEVVSAALPGSVPAADQARFELALLEGPHALSPAFAGPETLRMPPVTETPATLGDRILASVDQMRSGYQDTLERIDTALQSEPRPETRMRDMMEVFVDITKLSLQQEMLGKLAGKSTQNLDTLLKGQ